MSSIFAAYTIESIGPEFCFSIAAGIGFCVFLNGIFMPMSVESGAEVAKMKFCDRLKKNGREIYQGLKLREL